VDKKQTKKQLQEELDILELQKKILEVKKELRLLENEQYGSFAIDVGKITGGDILNGTNTPWYIGGTYTY